MKNYSFEYLLTEKFPNSKVEYYNNGYELLYYLLKEEIDGYLIDETFALNNQKKFPERITTFDANVINNIGLAF